MLSLNCQRFRNETKNTKLVLLFAVLTDFQIFFVPLQSDLISAGVKNRILPPHLKYVAILLSIRIVLARIIL